MIMGFAYEYTYQDYEYIIRTMNTSASNQTLYILVFLLLAAHKIVLSCTKHICDQVA